ncbi:unnamed protein product [Schistosoma mattheei]|uniref:Uncharacterized protein n=1 Tax=Schistosoma mattheei TaxID=31246 RepID=A0A183NEX8_9TREM|nr:unnamed protein product [Schistosoma mattheei]
MTSVSVGRTLHLFLSEELLKASLIANSRSTPKLKPTHGTRVPEESNIPTKPS